LEFKLTTKLLGVVLLIMGTTVTIVHIPWVITSRRNINDIVAYVNNKVTQGTEKEVDRIFANVIFAHRLIEESFLEQIDIDNVRERELFYLNLLEANSGFSWLQFGFPNGDFFGANRVSDTLSIVNRDWNEAKNMALKTSIFYTRDAQNNWQANRTEMVQEDFYSPQRPWYQAALANPGEIAWSEVYIFRTSRTPGISSGLALKNPETDELQGVVSIAFELKQISTYLHDYEKYGQFIFLATRNQEIIAASNLEQTNIEENKYTLANNQLGLKKIEDSENEKLQIIHQLIQSESIDFYRLSERQNFRYRMSGTREAFFISLTPLESQDWIIGIVIPESLYLKEIERNRQVLIILLPSMLLLICGLIFLLAKSWLARPILKITAAAAAIEQGNFQAIALSTVMQRVDELGQLARVFNRMAQEIYGREKELKQKVKQLQIEIDEARRTKEVQDIVETDFFKELQQKARAIRQRRY